MTTKQLFVGIVLLLTLIGATALLVFVGRPNPAEPQDEKTPAPRDEPGIVGDGKIDGEFTDPVSVLRQREPRYSEAEALLRQNSPDALALFQRLKETALTESENAQLEFMSARAQESIDPAGAVRRYKQLAADDELEHGIIRASAVNRMSIVYATNLTEPIFEEIFSGDLAYLEVVKSDGSPDVKASLDNLLTFGANIYPLATIELRRANNALNDASSFTQKIFKACSQNISFLTDDGCVVSLEGIFSAKEAEAHAATALYVTERISAAEIDMERLRTKDKTTLAPVLGEYATVLSKAASLMFVGKKRALAAHEEALSFSREHADREDRAVIRLNYASFLGATLWPDAEEKRRAASEILSEFYKEDWSTHFDIDWLDSSYDAITGGSQLPQHELRAHELNIIGPITLAGFDERWKLFLEDTLGWSFEQPAIRALLEN